MSVVSLFDAQIFVLASPDSGIAERFLRPQLESLPRNYRVAFAAACIERHAPRLRHALAAGASELEELGIGLDLAWESALCQGIDRDWLASLLRPCADLFQRQTPLMEEGARAMLACLEAARTGGSEPVVRVSRHIVFLAAHSVGAQLPQRARGTAAVEQTSPEITQARLERERQYRDLCELRKTAAAPSVNLVRRLRDRAAMEAALTPDDSSTLAELPRRCACGR